MYVRYIACGFGGAYIWASLEGTMSLSSPTNARPVARIRFSPFSVSDSSVVPVCRPFNDHSVSPCRMMKARGVVIAGFGGNCRGSRMVVKGGWEDIPGGSGEELLKREETMNLDGTPNRYAFHS